MPVMVGVAIHGGLGGLLELGGLQLLMGLAKRTAGDQLLHHPAGVDVWDAALQHGTNALVDLFRSEDGEASSASSHRGTVSGCGCRAWAIGGSCAASGLTIPTARAFLDHWFPW